MAVKKNPVAGKNYNGPVHGGEGKNNLKISGETEFSGVYRSAPNPKLSIAGGGSDSRDGKEEGRTFSGMTPSYNGLDVNDLKPTDLGVRNPSDVFKG